MWWSTDRLKPPADGGDSISFRTATLQALSCSFKSLEEELRCKGKGNGFGKREDVWGDAQSLWCKLNKDDKPPKAPRGMRETAMQGYFTSVEVGKGSTDPACSKHTFPPPKPGHTAVTAPSCLSRTLNAGALPGAPLRNRIKKPDERAEESHANNAKARRLHSSARGLQVLTHLICQKEGRWGCDGSL